MKILLTILITLLISNSSLAEEDKLFVSFEEGDLVFEFDNSIIAKKTLRQYAEIHPIAFNPVYSVAYPIEQCVDDDEDYFPCGSMDINDENFFKNAAVNLEKSDKDLSFLLNLPFIEELEPLVDYFKESLKFSIWLNKTLYQYAQTWDINLLKATYNDLDPGLIMPKLLELADSQNTNYEKYKLVEIKWSNAINNVFRDREGSPPKESWEKLFIAFDHFISTSLYFS